MWGEETIHSLLENALIIYNVLNENFKNKIKIGVEEMAQWIRSFAALAEDIDSVPSIHVAIYNSRES